MTEQELVRLREIEDENVLLKRLLPKMNDTTLLDIDLEHEADLLRLAAAAVLVSPDIDPGVVHGVVRACVGYQDGDRGSDLFRHQDDGTLSFRIDTVLL